MAARSLADTKRIRYLLDLCSQAERERIEAEYFKDDAAFQAMLTAEDDLIDAYARGELTPEERRKFETEFLISGHARDRVQFARAFSAVISSTSLVETRPRAAWLNIFESLRRWPLRIATVAGVIVVVVALSWIFVVRKRMSDEMRELRVEDAKASKQPESSSPSANLEEARHGRTMLQPENFQKHSDKSKPRKSSLHTQLARQLAIKKVDSSRDVESPVLGVAGRILGEKRLVQTFLMFSTRAGEALIETDDATLGNKFVSTQITQLPMDVRNLPALLTLDPVLPCAAPVAKSDEANLTLEGVEDQGTSRSFSLEPRTTKSNDRTIIMIASSNKSINLQLVLAVAKPHHEYRAVIETADRHQLTTLSWLTDSYSNVLNTPWLPTVDFPSGDYVLFLDGKTSDGSFVRVAEFSFRIVRN